ncbi:MAG TPA: hypothetical protein PK514_01820 [Spirochaetota bacterium]|nr:hypothetical protein [Spirochaetota bacterium]
MKKILSFEEFKQGLVFRIIIFAFIGIGWDVFMTFLQQAVSGKVNQDALCPASMWMFTAYGSLPLFFYPLVEITRHYRSPYPLRTQKRSFCDRP